MSDVTSVPDLRECYVALSTDHLLTRTCSVKKPKKTEQFDAQVVAAVEAKLRAFGIDDGPSSAAEAT